jgi:hypothetical protein
MCLFIYFLKILYLARALMGSRHFLSAGICARIFRLCECTYIRAQIVIIIRWMGRRWKSHPPKSGKADVDGYDSADSSHIQSTVYIRSRGVSFNQALPWQFLGFSLFSSDYANNNLSKGIDSSEFLICVDHSLLQMPSGQSRQWAKRITSKFRVDSVPVFSMQLECGEPGRHHLL